MAVIVLVEHTEGNIKKKSLEAVQYAAGIAQKTGTTVSAVVLGTLADSEMESLGQYGAQKVLHVADARLDELRFTVSIQAPCTIITAALTPSPRYTSCLNVQRELSARELITSQVTLT